MIVALTGTNWFGLKNQLDTLVNSFVVKHSDLALERVNGPEASYEHVVGAIESLPFLATKKMVVISDLSANKQASEALEKLLERLPETTDLIIVESKLDKRSVYYKQLKKLTDFQEYNELDENQLVDWLVAQAKINKVELGRNDAQYLVQRAGISQTKLAHELEKLIAYDSKISRKSIDLLVDETPASTIFNLLDSAFSGDLNTALKLYQEQRSQRIEPQAIHALLVWQMHAVSVVESAPENLSPHEIAQTSGMNPFVVQKSQRIARQMGRSKIAQFMSLLRDIDYKSKRETLDYDEALRFVIVSLASK